MLAAGEHARRAVLRCDHDGDGRCSGAFFGAGAGVVDRGLRMVAPSRRQPSGPAIILDTPRLCRADDLHANVPAHGRAPSRKLGESVGARTVQVGLLVPRPVGLWRDGYQLKGGGRVFGRNVGVEVSSPAIQRLRESWCDCQTRHS